MATINIYKRGTYDTRTQTYTSPSGQKQSMSISGALQSGATINFTGSPNKVSSGGGGGGSNQSSSIEQARQEQIAKVEAEQVRKAAEQEAQRQVQIQAENQSRMIQPNQIVFPRETIQNTYPKDINVYPPGTIYKIKGEEYDTLSTVKQDFSSRKATTEEEKEFTIYANSLAFETKALEPSRGKFYFAYDKAKAFAGDKIEKFSEQKIYDKEKAKEYFSRGNSNSGKVIGGLVTGIIPSTKGEAAKDLAIFGVTSVAGFGIKAAGSGLGAVPKAGKFLEPTFNLGVYGTGIGLGGLYGYEKTNEFIATKGTYGKAQVVSSGVSELGIGFFGFNRGAKAFDITQGFMKTRGRTFIEIPQAEYPTAPPSKQLEMFRKNTIKELGETPGIFHTTSDSSFYKGGTFSPIPGGSELPGTYGSTIISTPFSRIPGSGAKTKLFPSFKDILTSSNKPGVAFLKPIEFKKAKIGYTNEPTFEGQRPINNKYAFFKQPAKEGVAEVPGIKPEIEAILRVNSGDYVLESNKYYTEIKGVRVPLDTAVPAGGGTTKGNSFNPTKYKAYEPPAKIDITSTTSSFKLVNPKVSKTSLRSSSRSSVFSSVKLPSSSSISSSISSSNLFSSSRGSSSRSSSISSPSSLSLFKSSSRTSSLRRSFTSPPLKIGLPNFGRRKLITKTTRGKPKAPSRTPSLFAIGRGITSTRLGRGESSGLTIRPIIIKRRKKKLKGSRKKR